MNFEAIKRNVLSKIDFSRKGSIDESIKDLVVFINGREQLFTTSSCSGRICLFEEVSGNGFQMKRISIAEMIIQRIQNWIRKKRAVFGYIQHMKK